MTAETESMHMAIRLGDDGTMDTVLVCTDCGAEMRYNYDPGPEHEEHAAELRAEHPELTAEQIDRAMYDDYIASSIEDAEADHVCPSYFVTTWFERDRQHVALYFGHDDDVNDSQLVTEWWDDAVSEAVTDGFLNPRDYLGSALAYARSVGLAK